MSSASGDGWRREVAALFAAALETPPLDREKFVERECAGRPALRREVLSLLRANDSAEDWVVRAEAAIRGSLEHALEDAASSSEGPALHGQMIGRYRILQQLGRGGMGTVYLAERADGAFERRVALKILRRGLDTDDVLERFRAERQILADLEHPGIARLIDGGSAGGLPYLVLEYVEGVPITEYGDRRQLDVDRRLELFAAVCRAVHYAHQHDVVHRDLKPSNILVDTEGRVKLLDFGIARLLGGTAKAGAAHTRTGVRLMTPEYASPEQVTGQRVGPASDVYQLGLLAYELLSGLRAYDVSREDLAELESVVDRQSIAQPSVRFSGLMKKEGASRACATSLDLDARSIAQNRSTDPQRLRRRLAGDLDTIVLHALRKEPERRYATAEELARDVERLLAGQPILARPDSAAYRFRRFVRRRRPRLLTGAAIATVGASLILFFGLPRGEQPTAFIQEGTIAVLPFRVSGAEESLGYLREGMVDLLAIRLTGVNSPRSIDPTALIAELGNPVDTENGELTEDLAVRLASRFGAEHALVGSVTGTRESLVLSGTLLRTTDGEVVARATVEGPADSLVAIVDRMATRLLIVGAGESLLPLETLASSSLPALRSYLKGQADFRGARYGDAYDGFSGALGLDSAFALAAVRTYQTGWFAPRPAGRSLLELAWQNRDRLGERDLAIIESELGPDYPAPFSQVQRLEARRRLVEFWPDQAELQFLYADRIYHWSALIDLEDGSQRAAAQFRRVLEIDPMHAPTYHHLVPYLYLLGEADEATRLARTYLEREPRGRIAPFVTWRLAAAQDDSAALERIRARMDIMTPLELNEIYRVAIQDNVRLADARHAMRVLRGRTLDPPDRIRMLRDDYQFQLMSGRPRAAARVGGELAEAQEPLRAGTVMPRLEARITQVLSALYGDGDRDAAMRAIESLEVEAFAARGALPPEKWSPALCTVWQWRVWSGRTDGLSGAIRRLRALDVSGPTKETPAVCADVLETVHAVLGRKSEADDYLTRLDSILVTGPQVWYTNVQLPGNLTSARLHELLGNPDRALAAVRRRTYDVDSANLLLATSLRTEGRLAAFVGETELAKRAYLHYLALRSAPEPELQAQVDSVRAAFEAL